MISYLFLHLCCPSKRDEMLLLFTQVEPMIAKIIKIPANIKNARRQSCKNSGKVLLQAVDITITIKHKDKVLIIDTIFLTTLLIALFGFSL